MPPTSQLGLGLEGDPGPIIWSPSSPAADHKTFPRSLCTAPQSLPASLCFRINAAVTAAEKSPEQRRLTPGAARAGLTMGG